MPHTPTWTEVLPHSCVVVPLGSFEQHGPHLPLDTDTQIALHLCDRIQQIQSNIVVAAPIGIGASGEHAGFPGTLSIGNDVLALVIIELVRSCDWATGVVLVNGHGGNLAAVRQATIVLNSEKRRVSSWWPKMANADAHAGLTETSMMLAINPHAVRMHMAAEGNTSSLNELQHRLMTEGVAAVSTNGILGDARSATAQHGQSLLDLLLHDLDDFVRSCRSSW